MKRTARTAVLEVFEFLEQSTGRESFALSEVVQAAGSMVPEYGESTIRTYVTSVMCANAPVNHANHTDDLRRVGRGRYQRISDAAGETPKPHPRPAPESRRSGTPKSRTAGVQTEWFWEGNVQAAVVAYLAAQGWSILAVADTETRAAGADIKARRNGVNVWIEVKGYPSAVYARGPKQGKPKPTAPATQARTWFSNALLTAALLRADHPGDQVWLCFPDFQTYRSLGERIASTLSGIDVTVAFLGPDGGLEIIKPDDSPGTPDG